MKKAEYRILASLYQLLAECDAEAFYKASKQKGISPPLRYALRALADEASTQEVGRSDNVLRRRHSRIREDKIRARESTSLNLSPSLPDETYRANLYNFLMDKKHFNSRADLVEFAKRLRIPLRVAPKDSRKRVAGRIVSLAKNNERFKVELYKMIPNEWSSETQGWLNLILGKQ